MLEDASEICGPASPNLYWGNRDSNTKEWSLTQEPGLGHWLLSPLLFLLPPVSNFKKDKEVSQENAIPGLSILARYKMISHLENDLVIISSELPRLIVFIPLLCSSGQHSLGSTVIRIPSYCWGYSDPFSESKRSAHLSPCQSVLGVCCSLFSSASALE